MEKKLQKRYHVISRGRANPQVKLIVHFDNLGNRLNLMEILVHFFASGHGIMDRQMYNASPLEGLGQKPCVIQLSSQCHSHISFY